MPKMKALVFGLELCIQKGIDIVEIEGDSQIYIQAISLGKSPSWKIDNWIGKMKILLSKLNDFSISHAYREANRVADLLENYHVSQDDLVLIDSSLKRWLGLQAILE